MIKSMTGFGRGEYDDEQRSVEVEIRSVNHRYADISLRLPRRYSFAEEPLKTIVKGAVSRGKIDVYIRVRNVASSDIAIRPNEAVARKYVESLTWMKDTFDLPDAVSLSVLAGMPDVIEVTSEVEDEETVMAALASPLKDALAELDAMRRNEGASIASDLLQRGLHIEEFVREIEERIPDIVSAYAKKLEARMQELLGSQVESFEERIAIEAAVFADKSNVAEELVRLRSHVDQLRRFIEKEQGPVGKKLDFLVQEMNREANTIGSKVGDVDVTNAVIALKSEIEMIREQVQNIE